MQLRRGIGAVPTNPSGAVVVDSKGRAIP